MSNPYEWLQNVIDQVPDLLQPPIVALAGAVPYIEGEGAVAWAILAGIHPLIAAIAAATGNILCVLGVVFLGSRVRERVVARRMAGTGNAWAAGPVLATTAGESDDGIVSAVAPETARVGGLEKSADDARAKSTGRARGRVKLRRWAVKFGVPGASLLAPLALPTMLTAAFFVASGVPKQWVILWQVIAIVMWTGAVAILATASRALLGW